LRESGFDYDQHCESGNYRYFLKLQLYSNHVLVYHAFSGLDSERIRKLQ
jgi:hypothetical protein